MRKILEVKNLTVSFRDEKKRSNVVSDVSFDLFENEIIGIVGESGSGKSVLLQSILNLISPSKGKIESGTVLFQGQDLLKKSSKELIGIRGKKISMVFQEPIPSLNPTMKIGHQITESMLIHKLYTKKTAKIKALELLEKVGILYPKSRFEQYPHELSGGICQRVILAIALACNPAILLLDEPTTALDVMTQSKVLDLILQTHKQNKTSIILISHDLGVISKMTDRTLVMYQGKIVEYGTTQQVLLNPLHPYTKLLVKSTFIPNQKELPPKMPFFLQEVYGKGCPFTSRCPFVMKKCREEMPQFFEAETKDHKIACHLLNT